MKLSIIYFSRIGKKYSVGNISKENIEIIAKIIKVKTNAHIFKFELIVSYFNNYNEWCKEAREY